MNKYTKPLIILLAIASLGVITFRFRSTTSYAPTPSAVSKSKTSLLINEGSSRKVFDISQFIGKTVLAATQSVAKLETSGVGANAFVITINDRKADTQKHEFWELLINGSQAQVGAGSYVIQYGDSIEWHINTY